jgi:hypothetical protein
MTSNDRKESRTGNTEFTSDEVIPHFMNTMRDKQCKHGALCFYSSSLLVENFVLRNPSESKVGNRYAGNPNKPPYRHQPTNFST